MIKSYKETSIGDIPKEWELLKLVEICDVRDGTHDSPKYQEDGIPFITSKNLTDTELSFDDIKYISKEDHINFSKRSHVENGDILFGMIGTVGKPVIVNEDFEFSIKNVALLKFSETKSLNNIYALNILKSPIVESQFRKMSNGGVLKFVALGNIRSLLFPLPPLPEQQKIADILSTVDAKIEVIDQQINETQELKKGLMQRLLTKGIGHTEFKESPLGEIPKSWEVVKFRDLISSHCYGPRFSSKDYSETGNVKTIRGTDINKTGDILYNQVPTALLSKDFVDNHKLKDGDLVMITTADCGLTGVYFDQGFPFIPSAYAVRITLNEKSLPFYFKFIFQTSLAKNQVEKFIRKGTVANLPGSDILKFVFALPSIEEQQQIAEILSSVDNKLEVLSEKKATYQELKKGLMQQLLTGKVRVKV